MHISPKFSPKSQIKNCIYLLDAKSNLDKLGLSKTQQSALKESFKDNDFACINQLDVVAVFCKLEDLSLDKNKEKVRHLGYKTFTAIKNSCDEAQVIASDSQAAEYFLEGLILSSYQFDKYLKKKTPPKLKSVVVTNKSIDLNKLTAVTDVTIWARDLVNEPLSYLTATQLGKEIKQKAIGTGVAVDVLGKSKIEALKMGGLLAVNKGSIDPPTFTIMEYKGKGAKNKKPIVLVGKGVVYDTGGLSLKPTKGSMDLMKCDMAGAAAMAATIIGIAKLNLPLYVVALIPATDNRPGGNAYAPGDIVKMFDGTTVEVLNTDAEGRMLLADALAYAKKYKPELVIDAATLTGAAAAAIGPLASVAMGNAKQKELDLLETAGFATHDRIVQFPFWDEYLEPMKSKIADLKNIGGSYAGMITAGKFLEHFTDYPYIHLDIAGPAFLESPDSYRGLGGTGAGVRLLIEFLAKR